MGDGAQIESVILRYRERLTVCASTQVGCGCGCGFCATGRMGFVRQLTSGEIVSQILHFQRYLGEHAGRLSNVVFMGMGEPLLNTEHTLQAVQRLVDPRGMALAPGRITLSTVGIVPGILRLAEEHSKWPIKLAISLHAATDELRSVLIPINRTYPLAQLFEAVHAYTDRTRRRVFYEWAMIDGINDTEEQALALASRLRGLPSHVNLIQLNPTMDSPYRPASAQATDDFASILDGHGIPHTVRQRRGDGIRAGCGQLFTQQQRQRN
jgi:23S rRNA (adenine2503-C2)-methyltransferase